MAELDHWHPVLLSEHLPHRPIGVRLAGREIVLFRGRGGAVGALEDICPHRRMRLSLGSVVGDKLRCRYHGWTYDAGGNGESPGTPKLHACAAGYDVRETMGAVWVKSRGSDPAFPHFDVAGYLPMCTLRHTVKAPLELVLDNFCEIEHTPTTHELFGYPLEAMERVNVRFEPTETTVRVINDGPAKPVPLPLRVVLGIRRRYQFNDDWTTHFSPVYSVYDHWWSDPATGREGKVRWRIYIFFWPIGEQEVGITTFAFVRSMHIIIPLFVVKWFRGLMRALLDKEIRLDVEILEGLASTDPSIEGMKLSRFDRVLGLNRERLDRVYRGRSAGGPGAAGGRDCRSRSA
jgi:phenylpropionate dioxygenase-like ring-hydroxylating dioxygenase large terminal subunit